MSDREKNIIETLREGNRELRDALAAANARAEAAEARAERLQAAVDRLMAYRRDNALNFQLEKFDDYLRALEAELKGGEE